MAKQVKRSEPKSTQRCIVVVYEDSATRDEALRAYKATQSNSLDAPQCAVEWLSLAALRDIQTARGAAKAASRAQLIVFAMRAESSLSSETKTWIESWMTGREMREGTIVTMLLSEGAPGASGDTHMFLRTAAHRSGMDYLTEFPKDTPCSMPDAPNWYSDRAAQGSGLLEEILHHLPPITFQPPKETAS